MVNLGYLAHVLDGRVVTWLTVQQLVSN